MAHLLGLNVNQYAVCTDTGTERPRDRERKSAEIFILQIPFIQSRQANNTTRPTPKRSAAGSFTKPGALKLSSAQNRERTQSQLT